VKQAGEEYSWLVLGLLGLGHVVMFVLWLGGGWELAGSLGAALGAGGWWLVGTGLDWLGYRTRDHGPLAHWEFQPLSGALAGWTLPVVLLAVGLGLGGVCWGLALLLSSRR
jgi:hypothetical protein